jgi:hypothetical protein
MKREKKKTTTKQLKSMHIQINKQKCILKFFFFNLFFYTQNGCMNKKILQRLIPSQIPDRFMTSENLDHTNHN